MNKTENNPRRHPPSSMSAPSPYRHRTASNVSKIPVILIILCLWIMPLSLKASQIDRLDRLQGVFNWALKYYLAGTARTAVKKLELLLTYLDVNYLTSVKSADNTSKRKLLGQTWLLLGAAYEKLGNKKKAALYYSKAKSLSSLIQAAGGKQLTVESLDLYRLPMGRKIFL